MSSSVVAVAGIAIIFLTATTTAQSPIILNAISQLFQSRQQGTGPTTPAPNKTLVTEPLPIGRFRSTDSEISGDVTVMDEKTIQLTDFDYDGRESAYFVLGSGKTELEEYMTVDKSMMVLPDESGSCDQLSLYDDAKVTLKIPGDKRVSDFSYLMVYSVDGKKNLGYIPLPTDSNYKNGTEHLGVRKCSTKKLEDDESQEEDSVSQVEQVGQIGEQAFIIGANLISGIVDRFI